MIFTYPNRTPVAKKEASGLRGWRWPRSSLSVVCDLHLRYGHGTPEVRDFRADDYARSRPSPRFSCLPADAHGDRDPLAASSSIATIHRESETAAGAVRQSENWYLLASLPRGAAHEINNHWPAILGFSDLLADDRGDSGKSPCHRRKIRETRRAGQKHCWHLLSFARQVPPTYAPGHQHVVNNAAQLRALDLRSATTRVELQLESFSPACAAMESIDAGFSSTSSAMRWMPWRRPAAEFLPSKPSVTAQRGGVVFRQRPRHQGAASRLRSFLYDEARWERHRSWVSASASASSRNTPERFFVTTARKAAAVFRVELPPFWRLPRQRTTTANASDKPCEALLTTLRILALNGCAPRSAATLMLSFCCCFRLSIGRRDAGDSPFRPKD